MNHVERVARAGSARAARPPWSGRAYLVPVPLGVDGEPLGDDVVPDPLGVVVDDGGVVVVGGDADGVRSPPGRSPTRSVRDSLQAVSNPALSARAQKPVSNLFIG